ncbi:hypothetical protein ACFSPU_10810 [Haoranjiania flava]|uniref:Uncharacterized protein n=1 Tax=Haoranjiania flava TaxID=1856322 RepID=A0AAE3ILY0_9BACT|nr:hypothetical protein [Haoranjiania flava]MCU7694299.1 hypothetical protein [Haoranjiania flava]
MNSFELIEWFIVIAFVAIQLNIYFKAQQKIQRLHKVFPPVHNFKIYTFYVSDNSLHNNPREILAELENYYMEHPKDFYSNNKPDKSFAEYEKYKPHNLHAVELLTTKANHSYILSRIINTINIYLIRNKGYASDYVLLKEIVESNTSLVEKDIKRDIPAPFRMGVLGAILAIITGLLKVSDGPADHYSVYGTITAIALVMLFSGLLITFYLTGKYRRALASEEAAKTDFYTFILSDLMPLLNQNLNNAFSNVQRNLKMFNTDFENNMKSMGTLIDKNFESLSIQNKILERIESTDNMQFAKANIATLQELQLTTERFQEFSRYLDNVNAMLLQSKEYTHKINEMIARTDDFKVLGDHVIQTFKHNEQLIDFLQQHYNSLDHSRQMINNSVGKVNATLDESLDNLKSFTQTKILEIQKLIDKEMEIIQYAHENRNKANEDNGMAALAAEIRELNSKLEALAQQPAETQAPGGFAAKWKNLFGK